jgi:uncharacterized protein GlcG (DUF336 family)
MISNINRFGTITRVLMLFAATLVLGGCHCDMSMSFTGNGGLTHEDVQRILDQAQTAAANQPSLVRVNAQGQKQMTRMHMFVVNRDGHVLGRRSMDDAWMGSVSIAQAKAYTAAAFSSNQNALSSRSIGALSQPGGPLWQIGNSNHKDKMPGLIEFPGGLPLYKNGVLVGAIGVSGDGVEEDENVAEAGTRGYEAPEAVRVDRVTNGGVPFVK